MIRLVIYLLLIAAAAAGLGWLADNPGTLKLDWQGYDVETSVFTAVVTLAIGAVVAIMLWSILRAIWNSPAALGERMLKRRQKRGLDALSSGMIAIGAGDKSLATRYALQARKALPHEPLTHLLRAQAAQLSGDRATARRIFESMLSSPDTEQLGLRGLYLEAEREGETEAARQFAERALRTNTRLSWSSDALFDLQCKTKDWAGALDTLAQAKRNGLVEKTAADRKRAVLLAGQAQDKEENETDKALTLALEAHSLATDLVPAAAIAARILAGRGQTGKAAKIIQKAWVRSPHPDLAHAYAYARIGDSPRDRLDRVRQLAALNSHSIECPIAIATTAIEARLFSEARDALTPLLDDRLTQRVATLMARIEAGESDDKGRVREWLARAVNAARDPAWTADGIIADRWEPVSPVTGALDAFQWRVPVESRDTSSSNILGERLEELLAISAPKPVAPAAEPEAPLSTEQAVPAPKAGAAPIRRDEAVDADAVTVRPQAATPAREAASAPAKAPETRAVARNVPAQGGAQGGAAHNSAAHGEAPAGVPVAPAASATAAAAAQGASGQANAAAPAAPAKPAATHIEAKALSPVQRVSDVSIIKPATAPANLGKPVQPAAPAPQATPQGAAASEKPAATQGKPASSAPAATAKDARTDGKPEGKPDAKMDAKIFVTPRAPDDPGLDDEPEADTEAESYPKRIYRAVN